MRRALPFLIIGAVLVAALIAGVILFRSRMEPETAPPPSPAPSAAPTAIERPSPVVSPTATEAASPAATAPDVTPPPPAATSTPSASSKSVVFNYGRPGAEPMHVRGDPAAPVVLEEFGDFECLPCSQVFPSLEKLERDYGNRLVVVFRQHPLKKHRYGRDAARAAEAAGLQGKFWEMHDILYRNRDTWVPAAYISPYLNGYAADLGLDVDRFKTDMEGAEVARRIAADEDRGESLGIDRTPVLFINGQKIAPTARDENSLRAAIDKVLAGPSS
jgi:protein-disulfide isomerase